MRHTTTLYIFISLYHTSFFQRGLDSSHTPIPTILYYYTQYLSRCTLSRFWFDITYKKSTLVIGQYHTTHCSINYFKYFCVTSIKLGDRVQYQQSNLYSYQQPCILQYHTWYILLYYTILVNEQWQIPLSTVDFR
jgi:hypothetical protein